MTNAHILATEPAFTAFVQSGNGVYIASMGRTTLRVARQVGDGQAPVATVSVIGSKASHEVDLRSWRPDERIGILNELRDVFAALLTLNIPAPSQLVLTSLGEYIMRLLDQSS